MQEFIIFLVAALIFLYFYNIFKKKNNSSEQEIVDSVHLTNSVNQPTKTNIEEGLIKRMRFPVVGLNYEGRRKKLTSIIKQYKESDLFYYEPYEGLTNKEIKEEYFTSKIYEISEGLPGCIIEKEDDNEYDPNALRVLVKDLNGDFHHIGYVPREHCVEARELMKKYKMLVATSITGGKYKVVDEDEYGNEKVRIRRLDYGLSVHLSFWEST